MAFKPIVEIEIDDAAFRRFYDLFQTYSAKLDEMPEAWKELNAQMNESGDALKSGALDAKNMFAIAAAQAGVIAEELGRATKAQDHLTHATQKGSKNMEALRKSAKGVSQALSLIGGGIVKIAAFGGLGALLGGFGMDSLAGAAFGRFRSAGQAGVSPGLFASFQANAQQFLNISALEAAANAQIDIRKAGPLAALGINYRTAQGMSPADLAFEELRRARSAYLKAEKDHLPAANMPAISAYLALGGNIGDVRNAAMQPLSVLNAAQAATNRDAAGLGFSRSTAQSWANLKIALDKAGLTIQTALINNLVKLAPQIGELSKEFAGIITSLLSSKGFRAAIDDVSQDLQGLAKFLASKDFQADWQAIGADMVAFGSDVVKALRFLDLLPSDAKTKKQLGPNDDAWGKAIRHWFSNQTDRIFGPHSAFYNHFIGPLSHWTVDPLWTPGKNTIHTLGAIISAAGKYGVDPALAIATATLESGLNPHAVGDHGTSLGLFQLHRGGELGSMSRKQAFNAYLNSARGLREFRAVEHLSSAALLHRFSKQIRLSPYDKSVTHSDIMRLVGTPGEVYAAAQRPADPYRRAEQLNAIYTKVNRQLRMSNKPIHVTIRNHTAAHVATSVHGTAQ